MSQPADRLPASHRGVWYACGTANALPGKKYVYSGPMATYCAWHRPMAIYAEAENKTFFVYGNADNSPTICIYDHEAGIFAAPVVLGTNPDGDAHRNPTILIDDKGMIYVFYGAHGHPSHVLRSAGPYDISSWETRGDLADPKGTYPQPWELTEGELFVSYRHAPGWRCRVSRDGARSWEDPLDIVTFDGSAIYAVTIAEAGPYPRRVHIAWSRLGGGSPEEIATKHLWARRYNVYYAYSDDGGSTWKRSDGESYSLPITEDKAEKLYDCGEHGVWLKDIQLDAQGNPHILFIDADAATYESAWKLLRHTGDRWRISNIATGDHMYDDGGLVILGNDDLRVYAPTTASQPLEDGGEIEEWQSVDGGDTWTNTKHLTAGSKLSHNNVKVVFNHEQGPGDLRILWSYGDSVFPPETEIVDIYCYGEAIGEAARVFHGH